MNHEYLSTDERLREFCQSIANSPCIAFDTEFVSEDRYYPELCLLQVAAGEQYAIVDTLTVSDLTPFWQLLAAPGHTSIVHAGREEFRFCRRAINQRPADWFDIQIAAGLIGLDYPAAYNTLVQKLAGKSLGKGETRTNWRHRPLSKRQLEYALQDVVHLEPIYREITNRLDALGRRTWLESELTVWQDALESEETTQRWRRVSGISGLSPRQLAILRELWCWRDAKARERDAPPRRVLRDDLLVEMARRGSADPQRIRAVRGMDWRRQQQAIPEIAEAIAKGLALPDSMCPATGGKATRPQFNLLGQFLATAVNSMARSAQVAPGLVGSVQDVRALIAYHLGYGGGELPALAQGWRSEVVGRVVDRLLDGELAIRIANPTSNQPLSFEPIDTGGNRQEKGS